MTEPTREQIAAMARLVQDSMADEFGPGYVWNEYRDDARLWQPWADTEAGRSDWAVLDTAVWVWFSAKPLTARSDALVAMYARMHAALESGDISRRMATTCLAAAAIGEGME